MNGCVERLFPRHCRRFNLSCSVAGYGMTSPSCCSGIAEKPVPHGCTSRRFISREEESGSGTHVLEAAQEQVISSLVFFTCFKQPEPSWPWKAEQGGEKEMLLTSVVLSEGACSHLVLIFVELDIYFDNVSCNLFIRVRNLVVFNPCALEWLQLDVCALQS